MSVKYTKLPTNEECSFVMDYSSPFSYNDSYSSYKYRSAFKYSSNEDKQVYSDLNVECTQSSMISRVTHIILTIIFIILLILTFPISIWFSCKMIPNFQKIVIFRLGKLIGAKGPGLVCVIPCIDRSHKVDVRIKAFNVPPKQIITQDGAVVEVGADVHYRISDVVKSITCVQNLDQSTRILVQTTLHKILVQRSLADIETQRTALGKEVQDVSNEPATEWGVEICRIELSQVKVLRGPPAKQMPSVMFPPGMMSSTGGATSLPPAFEQVASAFMAATDGAQQTRLQPSEVLSATVQHNKSTASGSTIVMTILNTVQSVLTETLVNKVASIYQFHIDGDNGGVYYLDLKQGRGSCGAGMPPTGESDCTLKMSLEDLHAMFTGKLKPLTAYMSGRLQVAGDLDAAMRLEEVVKKVTEKNEL